MRFIIQRLDFLQMLTRLQSIFGQKPSLPILSNVLLEAKGNELTVIGTDLAIGIKAYTEAKVLEEGSITLPARRLTQLIRELTSHSVELSKAKESFVELFAHTSKFKIQSVSAREYPPPPDLSEATKVKIKADLFKDLLYRTAFAVAKEDSRFVLMGLLLQFRNGIVTTVGTDGKRLSKAHAELPELNVEADYILPIRAVEELLKNLEGEEYLTLLLGEERFGVETSSFLFFTKRLPGDFPDFMRIIPEKPQEMLLLHREELISLLKQVSLFTADSSQSVRFTFLENELHLTANARDVGEGQVSMPVQFKGERFDIAFNPGYFLDILRHCKAEVVTLGVTDTYNPGLVIDQEEKVETFNNKTTSLFMIMPMRLEQDR